MKLFPRVSCFVTGLLALVVVQQVFAQGTVQWTVTFDGSPRIPPTDDIAISYYYEQGMVFTPIGGGQFGRTGGVSRSALVTAPLF